MLIDAKSLIGAFSPRIIGRALTTLDKSTAVVVTTCWLAALVTLILAVLAVYGAISTQKEAASARAVEPVLPVIQNTAITAHDAQGVVDRLQHQFPEIKFEVKQGTADMIVSSDDGAKFHQWITALSYIDTVAPQYRWNLREFCVGACLGRQLMGAVMTGQKTTISSPKAK